MLARLARWETGCDVAAVTVVGGAGVTAVLDMLNSPLNQDVWRVVAPVLYCCQRHLQSG